MASTTSRGYGANHQREKARWTALLQHDGPVRCACVRLDCSRHQGQCATVISHDDRWDLGHTDDRTGWTGPECIPCNRGAGGRNGAAVTNGRAAIVIREW